MHITIVQHNPTVGDFSGNVKRLLGAYTAACERGADLVVAPELAVVGYPPRDFLERPAFNHDARSALRQLAEQTGDVPFICGALVSSHGEPLADTPAPSNGAVVMQSGRIIAVHRKMLLPTYDVFDEVRYFVPGDTCFPVTVGERKIGVTVCEDIWNDKDYWRHPRYARDPIQELVTAGAELIINVSASPYDSEKPNERLEMLQAVARRHGLPVLYANQVGGNDSLVFDGRSVAVANDGRLALQAPAFAEGAYDMTWDALQMPRPQQPRVTSRIADMLDALTLGLQDYVRKCGFTSTVVGLSGGIDSALTAAIATRALGADKVTAVSMPSRFTADSSRSDAAETAERLGIRLDIVPIEPMFQAFLQALAEPFAGLPEDTTEENLQARIRGTLLMAYSNKLGGLLLTTGNKSELAVGYSTLYGDMNGGLAVISDLYKTEVFEMARHLNRVMQPAPIPEDVITKPPSAELRADQKDSDSLPQYVALDPILRAYIEHQQGLEELTARGFQRDLVIRILNMTDAAEYKRRQMPPGLRVSRKAYGEGRRMPIAQRYKAHR